MVKQGIFQNLKGCAEERESATSGAEEVTWDPLRRDFRSENSGCLSVFVFPFFAYQFKNLCEFIILEKFGSGKFEKP